MSIRLYVLFFLISFHFDSIGQNVLIGRIDIDGNKKTKPEIILRELDFSIGDSISQPNLMNRLSFNQLRLMNTSLFSDVKMNILEWDTKESFVVVEIIVSERFYILPVPIFELADRNFNVWWTEQNHDFSRVNIGLKLFHFNLTGRRDKLEILGQGGYGPKMELEYTLPGINKNQTLGISFGSLYQKSKEIAFITRDNKLEFYDDAKDQLRFRFESFAGLIYRPKINARHFFDIQYFDFRVEDIVANELNSAFLGQGRTRINYFGLRYGFRLDYRDIVPYPHQGNYLDFQANKLGIFSKKNRNAINLSLTYAHFFTFSPRWSISSISKIKTDLIRKPNPYVDNQALGYQDDYIRGYELYVIDGKDFAYEKLSLRFNILTKNINLGKLMPIKSFKSTSVKSYLTFNSDFGWANDPNFGLLNSLDNKLLWGYGMGLDFVVAYSLVFQVEYSYNLLGESGIYIHFSTGL